MRTSDSRNRYPLWYLPLVNARVMGRDLGIGRYGLATVVGIGGMYPHSAIVLLGERDPSIPSRPPSRRSASSARPPTSDPHRYRYRTHRAIQRTMLYFCIRTRVGDGNAWGCRSQPGFGWAAFT